MSLFHNLQKMSLFLPVTEQIVLLFEYFVGMDLLGTLQLPFVESDGLPVRMQNKDSY